jgi:hypothetical protein
MKFTANKKVFIITILCLLLLFIVIVSILWGFRKDGTTLDIESYINVCTDPNCVDNVGNSDITFEATIVDIYENDNQNFNFSIKIWDSNTNKYNNFILMIDKDSLVSKDILESEKIPQTFVIKVTYQNRFIPIPFLYEQKIFLKKHKVVEVNFTSLSGDDASNLNFSDIKEKLSSTLKDLAMEDSPAEFSMIFSYKDGDLSRSEFKESDSYDGIALLDKRNKISNLTEEESLSDNCLVLKKYFPQSLCSNPLENNKNIIVDEILSYDIAEYEIENIIESSIVSDKDYVDEVRNNDEDWSKYYLDKNIVTTKEINSYMYSLLEFLYYSDYTCSEQEKLCDELYKLYDYSKFLISSSYGNLCSHLSFLPIFAVVSDDEQIKSELEYILTNYPYQSECTLSDGGEGFCSIDLEERFSCIRLIDNTLEYYRKDPNLQQILKDLVIDTILIYSQNNQEVFGVWGEEDINLLSSGTLGNSLYPVKYYNLESNYLLYKILTENFDE